jgi:phospholipase/lecithinase/hemolysin
MKQFRVLATALAAALLVAACGGGGDGNQAAPIKYTKVVSFGDSLSDAGTYDVGAIKLAGGGMFTVNGIAGAIGTDPVPSYNWAQLVSAGAIGKSSCAARVGGFGVVETKNPAAPTEGCWNYAQGGSRVSNANGIGNLEGGGGGLGTLSILAAGATRAGALTEPLTTQVSNYLTDVNNGGKFTGNELVTVLAGPNDLFAALDKLSADATTRGNNDFPVELAKLLVADISPAVTDPATYGADVTAIATAFGTAIAAGGSVNDGALAAVQKAATLGSANAVYIMTVIATAQAYAATPANIGAAMAADPTLTTTAAAGAKLFVQSLTSQLVAGIPAANQAAAATAIPTAFSTAYTAALTAGKSAASAQNLGILAAFQAAADAGSTKVSAVLGTSNHATLGNIGNATVAAQQFATTWAGTTGAQLAGAAVVQAADDLAAAVNTMVTTQGAKRVVVLNLPDMSLTPRAQSKDAATQGFNAELQAKLGVTPGVAANGVLLVDFFTNMQNNVNDPTHYALVAGTTISPVSKKPMALLTPVCNEVAPLNIGLDNGSSLVCTKNNITTTGDIAHFMFADGVHPTPYSHKLLSQVVNKIMIQAGWL